MTAPTESTVNPASTAPAGPIISFHAHQRMTQLRIPRGLIDRTLADPELTWPGRDGCVELVGSRLIVTLAPHDNIVVTVKLRTAIPYQHGIHDLHNPPARPPDSATPADVTGMITQVRRSRDGGSTNPACAPASDILMSRSVTSR